MKLACEKRDLLNSDFDVIVQQCNCMCVKAHGLSENIAKRYPFANPYAQRRAVGNRNLAIKQDQPVPGTIMISEGKNIKVVHFFAQLDYGKPGVSRRVTLEQDNSKLREKWFSECLSCFRTWLCEQNTNLSVCFPKLIGCGLAGGNPTSYYRMLQEFANTLPDRIRVVLCEL